MLILLNQACLLEGRFVWSHSPIHRKRKKGTINWTCFNYKTNVCACWGIVTVILSIISLWLYEIWKPTISIDLQDLTTFTPWGEKYDRSNNVKMPFRLELLLFVYCVFSWWVRMANRVYSSMVRRWLEHIKDNIIDQCRLNWLEYNVHSTCMLNLIQFKNFI